MPRLADSPALGSEYSVDSSSTSSNPSLDEKTPFIQAGDAEKSETVGLFVADDENEEEQEEVAEKSRTSNAAVIPGWIIIPIWIGLSGGITLLNKYIFTNLDFPYPVFLTTYHMLIATAGTQIMKYTTKLLDQTRETPMDRKTFLHAIVPLAILSSLSLVLGNFAYVYLSVSFVQILKAILPVLVHLLSTAVGLAKINWTIGAVLSTVSIGCAVAAAGEIRFSYIGVIFQGLCLLVEAARLVSVQLLLHARRMDPLVSIYYYAPVCAFLVGASLPIIEGLEPFRNLHKIGLPILLLNGAWSFAINVSSIYVIHAAGSTVLTLAGIFRNILLVALSVALLGSSVTAPQVVGYGVALAGLFAFKYCSA